MASSLDRVKRFMAKRQIAGFKQMRVWCRPEDESLVKLAVKIIGDRANLEFDEDSNTLEELVSRIGDIIKRIEQFVEENEPIDEDLGDNYHEEIWTKFESLESKLSSFTELFQLHRKKLEEDRLSRKLEEDRINQEESGGGGSVAVVTVQPENG